MGKVTSKLSPPTKLPCENCRRLKEFNSVNNIHSYSDYCSLPITTINAMRTTCSSCKGAVYGGYGSGSYKADLVMWWILVTLSLPPSGSGRTSRYSDADISRWTKLHDEGWSWQAIADTLGISRQALSNLVKGRCKRLKHN